MMKGEHRWLIGLGALYAALLVWLWIDTTYLFHPLTFRQDPVTYLPYSWYRSDVQVEYTYRNDDQSYQRIVSEPAEARQIIGELKRSLADVREVPRPHFEHVEGHVEFSTGSKGIVFASFLTSDGTELILRTNDKTYLVPLSAELRSLIDRRMSEAEPYGSR